MNEALNDSALWPVVSASLIISRIVLPIKRAVWNMEGISKMEGERSDGILVRSLRTPMTDCVVARLPAESRVITRSPSLDQVHIFLKVDILSTPALVRVSDMNTKPRFNLRPTQ